MAPTRFGRQPGRELTLGLDIGATKLAAGVVDAAGALLSFGRLPTPAVGGWRGALEALTGLAERAITQAGLRPDELDGVGIGCGGPLDTVTGIVDRPPNLPGWERVPVVDVVRDAFGRPTFLQNDANAAALGEHRWGSWAGTANLVYLTISSGIGSGIIIDGELFTGAAGDGGELGHTLVDWRGRRCGCGQVGCAEAYVSGSSIARRAAEAVAAGGSSTLAELRTITAADVTAAAAEGDRLAAEIWDDTTTILGRLVGSVLNIFEPNLVVLGGGVTQAGPMLIDPVRAVALAAAMPPAARTGNIVLSSHGPGVGVIGAAAVAMIGLHSEVAA